jgi:hypothetical protein
VHSLPLDMLLHDTLLLHSSTPYIPGDQKTYDEQKHVDGGGLFGVVASIIAAFGDTIEHRVEETRVGVVGRRGEVAFVVLRECRVQCHAEPMSHVGGAMCAWGGLQERKL